MDPCGKNKKVAHEPQASVLLMCLPHFDVFGHLSLNRPTAKWNLFVLYIEQKIRMTKISNLPRSTRLFEDLFLFRYFSRPQEHFSSRFLFFLARNQLLLNFRGLHLLNPE